MSRDPLTAAEPATSAESERHAALVTALLDLLRDASSQGVLFSQAIASRVGLNPSDLECTGILVANGPMTAGQIAEVTGLTTGAVTGLIDRLEAGGYARRERDPRDRRRVIVAPIHEAIDRDISPYFVSMHQASVALCSRYTDEELTLILDFMTRALQLGREETAKLQDPSGTPHNP